MNIIRWCKSLETDSDKLCFDISVRDKLFNYEAGYNFEESSKMNHGL